MHSNINERKKKGIKDEAKKLNEIFFIDLFKLSINIDALRLHTKK